MKLKNLAGRLFLASDTFLTEDSFKLERPQTQPGTLSMQNTCSRIQYWPPPSLLSPSKSRIKVNTENFWKPTTSQSFVSYIPGLTRPWSAGQLWLISIPREQRVPFHGKVCLPRHCSPQNCAPASHFWVLSTQQAWFPGRHDWLEQNFKVRGVVVSKLTCSTKLSVHTREAFPGMQRSPIWRSLL